MTDCVNRGAESGTRARIRHFGEPVVDPQTLPPGLDEACPSKVGQVARNGWLRKPQGLVDIADADFAIGEDTENPKPRRIRESAVHFRKFMNTRHIYVS
jgi:hypothetical protein